MAVDGLGCYYLSVAGEHVIRKFSAKGEYLTSIGRYGARIGEFSMPQGVVARADGTLLVCDTANARIQLLSPRSAPVLVPDVVRFAGRFAAREQAAEQAVKKMEIVNRGIHPFATLSQFAGTFLSIGAAAGAAFASSALAQIADARYGEYRAATTVAEVSALRGQVEEAWLVSRGLIAGMYAAAGIGSVLFATTLLSTSDQATARDRAVRNLQATEMDASYTVDASRYRSLRGAQTVGVLTGIVPPLIGGGVGIALLWTNAAGPAAGPVAVAVSVAIPPIWSHLYGGRFHTPLFIAGLIADGAALSALAITAWRPPDWRPASLGLRTGIAGVDAVADQVWSTAQTEAPALLMVAAVAVRLTAGIYDASEGWLQAKDYNKYRAVRKADTSVSLQVQPEVRGRELGVSIAVRY
jgi:hypothetical protein